jgi:hypothetical protein
MNLYQLWHMKVPVCIYEQNSHIKCKAFLCDQEISCFYETSRFSPGHSTSKLNPASALTLCYVELQLILLIFSSLKMVS